MLLSVPTCPLCIHSLSQPLRHPVWSPHLPDPPLCSILSSLPKASTRGHH